MKLEGSFTKDSSLNMSNMSNLYNFISMFGTLTYEIDGKTYAHPTTLRRVEAQKAKQDNIYYIEVVPDVSKATSIYFNFNVRGENYKYILK
jgi:hypothetical protein